MVDTVPDDFSPSLGIADAEGLEKASDGHIAVSYTHLSLMSVKTSLQVSLTIKELQ